jgi:hypothetical protein
VVAWTTAAVDATAGVATVADVLVDAVVALAAVLVDELAVAAVVPVVALDAETWEATAAPRPKVPTVAMTPTASVAVLILCLARALAAVASYVLVGGVRAIVSSLRSGVQPA